MTPLDRISRSTIGVIAVTTHRQWGSEGNVFSHVCLSVHKWGPRPSLPCTGSQPLPCTGPKLQSPVQSPDPVNPLPGHVQICSTLTSLFSTPPHPEHVETCFLCSSVLLERLAAGIQPKYLLVATGSA